MHNIFSFSGLNPAECEVNFLKLIKNMDFYGIDMHSVLVCTQSIAAAVVALFTRIF